MKDIMRPLAFQNPVNGYTVTIEGPFLGSFLIGPLYIGLKGAWGPAVGYFLLACATAGFFWFVFPFLASGILRRHFLGQGWTEIQVPEPDRGNDDDGLNVHGYILTGLAICSAALITLLVLAHFWTKQ